MSDLGPDARSLLDAARDGDEPSIADEVRVRQEIGARIAAAAALGAAAAVTAKGAAGGAATTTSVATSVTITTKVLVAVALTVGAASVTAAAVRVAGSAEADSTANAKANASANAKAETAADVAPSADAGAAADADADAGVNADAAGATEDSATDAAPAVARPAALGLASSRPRHPAVTPSSSGRSPSASAAAFAVGSDSAPTSAASANLDPLAAEAVLVRSAQLALARDDAASAMASLDEHAARFPNGALAEERDATRVRALCAQGRPSQARAAARTFVAVHPGSALAAAIRGVCAEHE